MQFINKCVIKDAGFFEGDIEGKRFETGQVFIEEEFDRTKANYKGFRTVEYKCTDSSVIKPLMHNPFPITAEVTFVIEATKRGQATTVTSVKPLDMVTRPMPKAA